MIHTDAETKLLTVPTETLYAAVAVVGGFVTVPSCTLNCVTPATNPGAAPPYSAVAGRVANGPPPNGIPIVPVEALAVAASTPLNFLGNKLWSFQARA